MNAECQHQIIGSFMQQTCLYLVMSGAGSSTTFKLISDDRKLQRLLSKEPDFTVRDPEAYDTFTKVVEDVAKTTEILDAATMNAGMPFLVPNLLCLPRPSVAQIMATVTKRSLKSDFDVGAEGIVAELVSDFRSHKRPNERRYNIPKVFSAFLDMGGSYHVIDATKTFDAPLENRFVYVYNEVAVESMIQTGMAVASAVPAGFELTTSQLQNYRFPKINVSMNDYILPVCHEAENRSQTVQAIASHVLGARGVSDSHGIYSGNDPMAYKYKLSSDVDADTDFNRMVTCTPGFGLNDYIDETTYPGFLTADPFLRLTGMLRKPKCGFVETVLGMGSSPIETPMWTKVRDREFVAKRPFEVWDNGRPAEVHQMLRSMNLARRWFTDNYYRPSVLRARAPHGRVVFVTFFDAGPMVVSRLVEAASKFGETLDNIYVANVNAFDVIAHNRGTKEDITRAIANVASLFRFTSTKCCAFCGTDYALSERPILQGSASSTPLFTCGDARARVRPELPAFQGMSALRPVFVGENTDANGVHGDMPRVCRFCGFGHEACTTCTYLNRINKIGLCEVCDVPLPAVYLEKPLAVDPYEDPAIAFGGRKHNHREQRSRRTLGRRAPTPRTGRKARSATRPKASRRRAPKSRRIDAKKQVSRKRGRTPK